MTKISVGCKYLIKYLHQTKIFVLSYGGVFFEFQEASNI